jgi:hypothetical protein
MKNGFIFETFDTLIRALNYLNLVEFFKFTATLTVYFRGYRSDSEDFVNLCLSFGIKISMSTKGSPWQNGYQESWYGKFKGEFGDFNRFESLGELVEEIYHQIYYYNNR